MITNYIQYGPNKNEGHQAPQVYLNHTVRYKFTCIFKSSLVDVKKNAKINDDQKVEPFYVLLHILGLISLWVSYQKMDSIEKQIGVSFGL